MRIQQLGIKQLIRTLTGKKERFGSLLGEGSPAPIAIAGRSPQVIAFHGFTGTPLEVSLLTDVAAELGLGAYAPVLPGHATHARDLGPTRWVDWVGHAEAALLERTSAAGTADAPHPGKVVLCGLSMGALIAIHLAAKYPERVKGVVLLANAVHLQSPYPTLALRLVERLRLPDFWMPKSASDIADEAQRKTHRTYSAQPVHAAIEVLNAGERVLGEVMKITAPALIIHGRRDLVCPWQNAYEVANRWGSRDTRVVILPRSHHIVTRDVEALTVRHEVRAFLQRLAS